MADQDEYAVGLNGCEHEWRSLGHVPDGRPAKTHVEYLDRDRLEIKWCTVCGCAAREMPDGSWHVMYPDSQDGSDE